VSWRTTLKALKADGEGYMITPCEVVVGIEVEDEVLVPIEELLDQFNVLFHSPKGLPTPRAMIIPSC